MHKVHIHNSITQHSAHDENLNQGVWAKLSFLQTQTPSFSSASDQSSWINNTKKREQNKTAPLKNSVKFCIATEKKIGFGESKKNFCP